MDNVEIFYYDQYNRKISYTCTSKEFNKYIAEFLEEHQQLDKGVKLCYTYKTESGEFDYFNIPSIKS